MQQKVSKIRKNTPRIVPLKRHHKAGCDCIFKENTCPS